MKVLPIFNIKDLVFDLEGDNFVKLLMIFRFCLRRYFSKVEVIICCF